MRFLSLPAPPTRFYIFEPFCLARLSCLPRAWPKGPKGNGIATQAKLTNIDKHASRRSSPGLSRPTPPSPIPHVVLYLTRDYLFFREVGTACFEESSFSGHRTFHLCVIAVGTVLKS